MCAWAWGLELFFFFGGGVQNGFSWVFGKKSGVFGRGLEGLVGFRLVNWLIGETTHWFLSGTFRKQLRKTNTASETSFSTSEKHRPFSGFCISPKVYTTKMDVSRL